MGFIMTLSYLFMLLVMVPRCHRRLARTTGLFLHLGTYIVPSGTRKASPKGGGFQVTSSLGPLGPVSKVCGAFSNRDLSSTSGE